MRKRIACVFLAAVLLMTSVSFSFADSTYTVKSGDVLWKIAQKYDTTWQKLAEINKLQNPHLIFPGQIINLESGQPAAAAATVGTYTAEAQGRNGIIKVSVTMDGSIIKEVKITEHNETKGVADAAITNIPAKIVEGQTLAIDTVAGATISSKGILAAVEAALTKAGADIAALKVKKANTAAAQKISKETDIVVVGAGIAGLAATLEAAYGGAKVILLEKMPAVGGSTIRSGAKLLAAESSIQKANGIKGTADDFAKFLIDIGEGKIDESFAHLVADQSGPSIEWLIQNGVAFEPDIEALHSTRSPARGHMIAEDSGANLIKPLEAKALSLGVELLLETPATSLITENGKVTGVNAKNAKGDEITIKAKSVILATGGFDWNKELIAKYYPSAGKFQTNVPAGNTGDGLIMAQNVGAQILNNDAGIMLYMNFMTGWGYGEAADGLFVTPQGKRFMNENDFHFTRTRIMYDEGIDHCYYIIDESDYNDGVGAALKSGTAWEAATIEELAGKIGADTATLKASFDRFHIRLQNHPGTGY